MVNSEKNIIVKHGDNGIAVEDVQQRLHKLGYLKGSDIDCCYGDKTVLALNKFCEDVGIEKSDDVTEKIWTHLVDATFTLGDRNLYLNMPYFHGSDVKELQHALGSLGFQVNYFDGIFGPSTERALRRFQTNMGLPNDGIAGSQTFMTIKNLQFTWSEKKPVSDENFSSSNKLWRTSEVLENNSICLFGTDEFTRDISIRMSNIARATNPFSKILSSNAYSVAPDSTTMLLHIVLPEENNNVDINTPKVTYSEDGFDEETYSGDTGDFIKRLINAIPIAKKNQPSRLTIEIPGKVWLEAGEDRSAQHFAITILDALCSALDKINEE